MEIRKGDRVRLTDRAVAVFNVDGRPNPVDWSKRQGTVVTRHRYTKGTVLIKWDDRRTLDQWPENALAVIRDG